MKRSKSNVALASEQVEPTTSVSLKKPKSKPVQKPKTESKHWSKQARVIAMLQSPAGATIAAVMKATGWQQHSVRGFLAGTVRKRLRLKVSSKKVDGDRVYRVSGISSAQSNSDRPSRYKP